MTPQERERGEALRQLTEKLKGKPCAYGEDDCSIIVAQWIADITSREFDWPIYGSKEQAYQIINEAGGLVALWSRIAQQLGLPEWDGEKIDVGDVGIIMTDREPVGGIFLFGGTFLWRAEQGVRVIGVRRKTILKVWKV